MRSNDEIIRYLTQLKSEQQLTISEIARRTGMAKSAISRYFNKSREFPVNKVDDFAKVFNVTPEEILGIKKETDGLAVDNLRAYQGKPISDDEKEVLKDIIKGYLDRR